MQSAKKWLNYIQVLAAIGLGASYFLPFYKSAAGKIRSVDEWVLFFWVFPIIFILSKISNCWLKAVFCLLAIIGGLLDLFAITFLATFKSTGLIGYDIAQASLITLAFSWFVLGEVSLFSPKQKQVG